MSKKDQRTPEENETFKYIRQQINDFVAREYGFYYQKAGQTRQISMPSVNVHGSVPSLIQM